MIYQPIFHPRVESDVRAAMAHYEHCVPGLGQRFKRTLYATVDEMLRFSEKSAVKVGAEIRTRLMRPFPYLIFHVVQNGRVFILAVQFAGRKPEYLQRAVRTRRTEK